MKKKKKKISAKKRHNRNKNMLDPSCRLGPPACNLSMADCVRPQNLRPGI